MLVLTRKTSEMIQIGDDIVVKVIRTGRSTVKIGIDAPHHLRVLRAELTESSQSTQPAPAATANGLAEKSRITDEETEEAEMARHRRIEVLHNQSFTSL